MEPETRERATTREALEAFLDEHGRPRLDGPNGAIPGGVMPEHPDGVYHCPKCGEPKAHIVDGGPEYALACEWCGLNGGATLHDLRQRLNGSAPEAAALDKSLLPGAVVRGPVARVVKPLQAHTAGAIITAPREEATFRVPGVCADGVIHAYGGSVGHGKTPSTVDMLAAMLNGGEWLGIPVERVPDDYKIAYLTQESLNTFQPLLQRAGISPTEERLCVFYAHEVFASGQDWSEVVEGLTEWLGGNGLLVVDTFRTFARLRNEKDDSEVSSAMVPVVQAAGTGIGVWLIMHTWKTMQDQPDDDTDVMHFLAAGELTAVAGICAIYRKPKSGRDNERYFKVVRSRFGDAPAPRYVELVDGKLQVVARMTQALRVHNDNMRKVYDAVIAKPGQTKSEIEKTTALSQQRVSDAIQALEEDGRVRGIGTPRSRTNPVRYSPGAGPDELPDVPLRAPMQTEAIWREV